MVTNEEIARRAEGKTMLTYALETARRFADKPQVRFKDAAGEWRESTWGEAFERAARVASGLRALGLQRRERVAIMMRNRPEFYPCDTGTVLAGGTPFSIYNSSAPEQIQYIVHHSEAAFAIVEDVAFLERFLKVRDDLPLLREIIVVDDPDNLRPEGVRTLAELLEHEPLDADAAAADIEPDDLLTLVYTSGTTGPPKAAVITHRNMTWVIESALEMIGHDWDGLTYLSYLPMAHILERFAGYYSGMAIGGTAITCPDVMRLAEYLRESHPQIFAGVPRVFEKIHSGLMAVLSTQPEEQQENFRKALEAGRRAAEYRVRGEEMPDDVREAWEQADASLFSIVRALVGLDQVRFCSTGAAPIQADLIWFFNSIGVPLVNGYGMTESSCLISYNPYRFQPGSVGLPIPGIEIRIADDGEILFRGGNVFGGYLKDEEKTRETIDEDGWLHTGDVGRIDEDGFLYVVDRKKELIITAGGKNISPANIEAALKSFPIIGQAAAIGDDRRYVSALIALDPEVAPQWARSKGIEASTPAELAAHPEVVAEVQRAVDEANKRFNKAEQVKRFTIVPDEWQPDSDVLTPTMKLKRRGINERYAAEIEAMYA